MQFEDLKEIERRPRQYWTADGLPDLVMGTLWIVWGAAFLVPELLPQGRWLAFYWATVPFVLMGGAFASNWATKKLKQRLTFPRTGYVEWPEPGVAMKIVPALIGTGVAAGILILARRADAASMDTWIAPGVALLMAVAFLIVSVRQRLPHCLWTSGASLALALVFAMTRPGIGHALVCLFLVLGTLSLLLGWVRLRSYLRRHPLSQEGGA